MSERAITALLLSLIAVLLVAWASLAEASGNNWRRPGGRYYPQRGAIVEADVDEDLFLSQHEFLNDNAQALAEQTHQDSDGVDFYIFELTPAINFE